MLPCLDLDGFTSDRMAQGCWRLWSRKMQGWAPMWQGWWWSDGGVDGGQYGTEPAIRRMVEE